MMALLQDKVALVTGGASGIGLATARKLAAEGAHVVIVDIDQGRGAAAADEIGGSFIAADVSSADDWNAIADSVSQRAGGLDVAHLNAGVAGTQTNIAEVSDQEYRRIMGINLDGVVFGVRAVVPLMVARGGGAIVATSSLAGLIAFTPDPLYTVTKHAVVGLVRALSEQLAAYGITINAVCPGLTDTPLIGEGKARLEAAGFPIIAPEQIADAVVGRMVASETGLAWVCQAGREAVAYHFRRVPGPRVDGEKGVIPPAEVRGADQ
jgi:NAD(P)-dependent dehydrogenase (short-subunit alcohol dehydrogenase family)